MPVSPAGSDVIDVSDAGSDRSMMSAGSGDAGAKVSKRSKKNTRRGSKDDKRKGSAVGRSKISILFFGINAQILNCLHTAVAILLKTLF